MFSPTQDDVVEWFSLLNEYIFDDELPDFNKVIISRRHKVHAECILEDVTVDGDMIIHLSINHRFKDLREFVNIVGHEMVHMFQFLNGDTGKHNKMFYSFQERFKQNNLRLQRDY